MTNSLISDIDAGIACGARVGKAEIFLALYEKKEGLKQGDTFWLLVNSSDSIATVAQVIEDKVLSDAQGVLC